MLLNNIKYDHIIEKIATMILNEYKVGDQIPTERELAKMLNVSRPFLRESLQIFKNMGVLQARQGSGIYIAKMPDFLNNPTAIFAFERTNIQEMLEVREALELKAYSLIPDKDFDRVSQRLAKELNRISCDNKYDKNTFIEHDIIFHGILRKASNNNLLSMICEDVSDVVYDERNMMFASKENIDRSLSEHFKIYEAFKNGNRQLAIDIYTRHVDIVRQFIAQVE